MSDHLSGLRQELFYKYDRMLSLQKESLNSQHHKLEKLNPKAPMDRGFTRILQNGRWIRQKGSLATDRPFEIEWIDGKTQIN